MLISLSSGFYEKTIPLSRCNNMTFEQACRRSKIDPAKQNPLMSRLVTTNNDHLPLGKRKQLGQEFTAAFVGSTIDWRRSQLDLEIFTLYADDLITA